MSGANETAAPAAPVAPAAAPPAPAAAAPSAPAAPAATTLTPPQTTDAGSAAKAAEAAPKEEAKAEAKPEADFEVKLPAGVEANAVLLDEFKPLAKELGLKGEQAQKLVDLHVKALNVAQEQARAGWEKTHKSWADSIKTDKEYGGKALDETMKLAHGAISKFASPEFLKFLEQSGLGDHPEMVRAFWRIGKADAEDRVSGTTAPASANSKDAELRARYPTMFQDKP